MNLSKYFYILGWTIRNIMCDKMKNISELDIEFQNVHSVEK